MNIQTRRLIAAFGVALAAVAAVTAAGPAMAADPSAKRTTLGQAGLAATEPVPGGFSSWQELYNQQHMLNELGGQLLQVAETTTGYAGIVADPTNRRLDLYWNGALPEPVARILAANPAVAVQVHPARYAKATLESAARPLRQLPGVTGTGANVDGSGLKVWLAGQAPASTVEALRSLAVPYAVEQRETADPLFGKQDDTSPFWGGARIRFSATGARCSTGFGMKLADKSTHMLTAGHCTPYGWSSFDDFLTGAGNPMGQVSQQNDDRDVLLIKTAASGVIYTGNFDSTTAQSVGGAANSFVGNFVCRSSSFSNQMCAIKVTWVDAAILMTSGGQTYWVDPMVEAVQINGQAAAGNGDSGGSVYAIRPDGKLTAMGTVTAGDNFWTTVPCTGIPSSATRKCTWKIWYADVQKTAGAFKATVITN